MLWQLHLLVLIPAVDICTYQQIERASIECNCFLHHDYVISKAGSVHTEWSKHLCAPDDCTVIVRCTETFWTLCMCIYIYIYIYIYKCVCVCMCVCVCVCVCVYIYIYMAVALEEKAILNKHHLDRHKLHLTKIAKSSLTHIKVAN